MARLVFALLAAVTAVAPAGAAERYPVLVYPVARAEVAPRIDGKLDDAAWQKAPLVSGFTFYNKHEVAAVQTAFRAVYDEKALYVAVRAEEPLSGKLTLGPRTTRDSHAAVFGAECIEFFIDPRHDHTHYYQIAAVSNGTIFDGREHDDSWSSNTEALGEIGDGFWTLEVAIPWAGLDGARPVPGAVLGVNLCRDRNISPAREWTTWSQIAANFHDPAHFGHFVLSPTPAMLGKLSEEFHKGGADGPVCIYGPEGFSGTTYLALATNALGRVEKLLGELDAMRGREASPQVAAALGKRIEAARATVAPFAAQVRAGTAIDAADWMKADLTITDLCAGLERGVWEARLEALLREL